MTALLRFLRSAPPRPNPDTPLGAPRVGDLHLFRAPNGMEEVGVVLKADTSRVALRGSIMLWPRVPPGALGERVGRGEGDDGPLGFNSNATFARRWLGWPYGHYAAAIAEGAFRARPVGGELWELLLLLEERGVDPLNWAAVWHAVAKRSSPDAAPAKGEPAWKIATETANEARHLMALGAPPVRFEVHDRRPPLPPEGYAAWEWVYRVGDVTLREDFERRPQGVDPEDLAGEATRVWMARRMGFPDSFRDWSRAGHVYGIAVPTPRLPDEPGWWRVEAGRGT